MEEVAQRKIKRQDRESTCLGPLRLMMPIEQWLSNQVPWPTKYLDFNLLLSSLISMWATQRSTNEQLQT